MIWRFADFELDEDRRELRLRGEDVPLQPRVLDVLLYLARNRDRVVPKDELLERVWPEVIVTESSLQRAVSLARSALREGGVEWILRAYPRRGYRFCQELATGESEEPRHSGEPAGAEASRRAFEEGNWEIARKELSRADVEAGLGAEDLERWAWCFLNLGRPADAVAPLERAVVAHSAAGDRRGSARAAVLLVQIHFEGRRTSVAKGWHRRAVRPLDREPPCREQALTEWMAGRIAFGDGDHDEAARRCARAVEIARGLGDVDAEAVALVYEGHAELARGETRRGLALQDEAAAAVIAGAVDPWYAGLVYCSLVYVCQNRGDWTRAAEWTDDFTRWSERCPVSTFPSVCRLHRAEVLSARGELDEAEREIREICAGLAVSAPWAEGDAYRLLGDVRLARGDLDGADTAFRRARALGWDPSPGWSFLLLEHGDEEGALRSMERALDDPAWACRQRRRFLLASLARIAVAAGRLDRARDSIEAIEGAEDRALTDGQRGALDRARAELAFAEGRTGEAVGILRGSARSWQERGRVMEVAPLRFRLAEMLYAGGDPTEAELELRAAEEIFESVDAHPAFATVGAERR